MNRYIVRFIFSMQCATILHFGNTECRHRVIYELRETLNWLCTTYQTSKYWSMLIQLSCIDAKQTKFSQHISIFDSTAKQDPLDGGFNCNKKETHVKNAIRLFCRVKLSRYSRS